MLYHRSMFIVTLECSWLHWNVHIVTLECSRLHWNILSYTQILHWNVLSYRMSLVTGIFLLHWNIHTNRAILIVKLNYTTVILYSLAHVPFNNKSKHLFLSATAALCSTVANVASVSNHVWSFLMSAGMGYFPVTLDLQSVERQAGLVKCTVPSLLSSLCRLLGRVLKVYTGLVFLNSLCFYFHVSARADMNGNESYWQVLNN